jgi:hypothetical protein
MISNRLGFYFKISVFLPCVFLFSACAQAPVPPSVPVDAAKEIPAAKQDDTEKDIVQIGDADMMNLMLDVEDQFSLEDVIASQSGSTMVVRFKAPTISDEELNSGLVQVLAYLNEKMPSRISTVNLVFMVNNIDSLIIKVNRTDIRGWKDGKISNADFIKTFQKTSLL